LAKEASIGILHGRLLSGTKLETQAARRQPTDPYSTSISEMNILSAPVWRGSANARSLFDAAIAFEIIGADIANCR
jgi:hypothetical protein